jgi:hypothetical protein
MFGLAANGRSVIQIRDHLRKEYPARLAFVRSWVLRVLHNPVYTGKISKTAVKPEGYGRVRPLPGEWVDSHEPIVPPDLFAIVQKAIEGRARGRRPTEQSGTAHYLMRGIARCAFCKSLISPIRRSPPHTTGYYVCNRRLQPSQATGERCKDSGYLRQDRTDETLTKEIGVYVKSIRKALARPPAHVKRPDFERQRIAIINGRENVLRLVAAGETTFEAATRALRDAEDKLATLDAAETEFKASLTDDTAENRRGEFPGWFGARCWGSEHLLAHLASS